MPLRFVTLEQLRTHTKADGDDDELLQLYGEAAENFCANECQLNVYLTQAELDAALLGCADMFRAAITKRDAALQAADAEPGKQVKQFMTQMAYSTYASEVDAITRIQLGRVVGPSFLAAVLLIAGHLYRNREEVTSGINHGATKLPVGYKHMLHQFTRYGV